MHSVADLLSADRPQDPIAHCCCHFDRQKPSAQTIHPNFRIRAESWEAPIFCSHLKETLRALAEIKDRLLLFVRSARLLPSFTVLCQESLLMVSQQIVPRPAGSLHHVQTLCSATEVLLFQNLVDRPYATISDGQSTTDGTEKVLDELVDRRDICDRRSTITEYTRGRLTQVKPTWHGLTGK